jgi:4-diphosphocytidyl-2-C-methyl-D-erythritol kinase
VTARAPAKVNLQLSVGALRDDGFHSVVSVFHAVGLYDEVTVEQAGQTSVLVTGEGSASVPTGPGNLAVRAAAALSRAAGLSRGGGRGPGSGGVRIQIRKRIPVAAGLAGGSADAAAALVACNELWQAGATPQELSKIGASLGSDVPFALAGGTAVGQGRGELLTSVLAAGSYHWVLAFAAAGLAAADVYAACDRLRSARTTGTGQPSRRTSEGPGLGAPRSSAAAGEPPAPTAPGRDRPATAPAVDPRPIAKAGELPATAPAGEPANSGPAAGKPKLSTALMAALRSGDPAAVGPLLANDLQPAAVSLLPVLRRALSAGGEFGALGAVVSGSGPTCAFLAGDAAQARELAVALTGAGVCRAVVSVTGPAPGAALVAPGRRR